MEIPRFPITPHLPDSLMQSSADVWATDADIMAFKVGHRVLLQEKIDGANVGIHYDGKGEVTLRNRDHHLKKGYQKKETPSKLQFRPLWGWIYDHRVAFKRLSDALDGYTPIVYAEWLFAQHTIAYDLLPDLLLPFDLLTVPGHFMDPFAARDMLVDAGFCTPPELPMMDIHELANQPSRYSSKEVPMEGVYAKIGNGIRLTHRVKFVRPTFKSRDDFTTTELAKNKVAK